MVFTIDFLVLGPVLIKDLICVDGPLKIAAEIYYLSNNT